MSGSSELGTTMSGSSRDAVPTEINTGDEDLSDDDGKSAILGATDLHTSVYGFICVLALATLKKKVEMEKDTQLDVIKLETKAWIDLLKEDYKEIYKTLGKKESDKEKFISELHTMQKNDVPIRIKRKGAAIVAILNNHIIPGWKQPIEGDSGNQYDLG
jgi:hypothetical protein